MRYRARVDNATIITSAIRLMRTAFSMSVSEKLGVPGENIYMNIIALDEWFSGRK